MFKRIDHVELITDQAERAIAFYTGVLGFKVRARDRVERSSIGVPIDLVYMQLGDSTVELISYEGAKVAAAPSGVHLGYNLMALEVEDMSKAIEFLKGKGVEIVWGPKTREHSARAEIIDPDGNHIELRHWF